MQLLMPIVALGWVLALPCTSAFAQGGIYKWTDATGSLHFSNTPTREAQAVDDILPPAANFERQAEPLLPALTAPKPVPQASVPPANASEPSPGNDETPPAPNEPTTLTPMAADTPGVPAAGPFAGPVPAATDTQPTSVEPDDTEESQSETE